MLRLKALEKSKLYHGRGSGRRVGLLLRWPLRRQCPEKWLRNDVHVTQPPHWRHFVIMESGYMCVLKVQKSGRMEYEKRSFGAKTCKDRSYPKMLGAPFQESLLRIGKAMHATIRQTGCPYSNSVPPDNSAKTLECRPLTSSDPLLTSQQFVDTTSRPR